MLRFVLGSSKFRRSIVSVSVPSNETVYITSDSQIRSIINSNPKPAASKTLKRITSKAIDQSPILIHEIKETISLYNRKFQTLLHLESLANDDDLIRTFSFSKNRPYHEIKVEILYQSSEGEGYGIIPKASYSTGHGYTLVIVPKTVVGDLVRVRLLMHHKYMAESSLLSVESHSQSKRDNSLIRCDKFNECNGCQLQMLRYEDQLEFKKDVITRAYKFLYPSIFDQINDVDFGRVTPSPMQYYYRTKITPHYSWNRKIFELAQNQKDYAIPIGFMNVDPTKPKVDINHCPIATNTLNQQLPSIKADIIQKLKIANPKQYLSTALLRESMLIDLTTGNYNMIAITDPKSIATEKVANRVFQFPANEFFQNNNHILPDLLNHIKSSLQGVSYKNIIDTYCGSGFLGISLSDLIKEGKVFGIEISSNSVRYASNNAKLNGVQNKTKFIEGKADIIFKNAEFETLGIEGNDSIVIMDPSRKGSSLEFLSQLYEFKPKMIIYVSCNVFTQARDLEQFMNLSNGRYKIKSIRGFDFFPQTKHVETVAILELA